TMCTGSARYGGVGGRLDCQIEEREGEGGCGIRIHTRDHGGIRAGQGAGDRGSRGEPGGGGGRAAGYGDHSAIAEGNGEQRDEREAERYGSGRVEYAIGRAFKRGGIVERVGVRVEGVELVLSDAAAGGFLVS